MAGVFADVLVALLAAMLIVAATGDLRTRTIPNWLNGAIAAGAVPFWFMSGLGIADIALQVAIAAAVLALFWVTFQLGWMGGGDVKLVAAIALWLPPLAVMKLLILMSLAGGVLTIVMVARSRLARSGNQPEIPYGVAIAFGGCWLIGERFLNQFG